MRVRSIYSVTVAAALYLLQSPMVSAWAAQHARRHQKTKFTLHASADSSSACRRDTLKFSLVAVGSLLGVTPTVASDVPNQATRDQEEGMMSRSTVAKLLRAVPTFAIVDKDGIPFMVVGEDAKVTGYFFTSYGEAERILEVARKSADISIAQAKKEGQPPDEIGTNPWKMARISSVPLDSAVTLVTKSAASFGGGNYFRIAPSEKDVDDALSITGQTDLAEGKVPMFYLPDFTLDIAGQIKSPLYFRKSELEEEWKKMNKGLDPPKILVTELFAVLREMVKSGDEDKEIEQLVFVAPKESQRKRDDCDKKGGTAPPFVVGKRIIVL